MADRLGDILARPGRHLFVQCGLHWLAAETWHNTVAVEQAIAAALGTRRAAFDLDRVLPYDYRDTAGGVGADVFQRWLAVATINSRRLGDARVRLYLTTATEYRNDVLVSEGACDEILAEMGATLITPDELDWTRRHFR